MTTMGNLWRQGFWLHYRFATCGNNQYAANVALLGVEILFRNLAVAGAITEAARRGYDAGYVEAPNLHREDGDG